MTATLETDVALRDVTRGENPLKLKRIHHVEFCVGNAKQSAYFYRKAFGFSQLAYSGSETGNRETGLLRPLAGEDPLRDHLAVARPIIRLGEHIRKHGDGVRDIALQVEDADFAFAEAVRRGARPASSRTTCSDEHGTVRRAAIHTYGDTMHSFISLQRLPRRRSCPATSAAPSCRPTASGCWSSTTSSATSSSGR